MKKILLAISTLLTCFAFCQDASVAQFEVLVTNMEGVPQANEKIVFVGETSKAEFSAITDAEGKFKLEFPTGQEYIINISTLGEQQEYNRINIAALGPNQYYPLQHLTIQFEMSE